MSSHRFPSEDAPRPERFPSDGALGTIRAHDQAAIDHFLLYAEQERQRLEAQVIEAEQRCREADQLLVEATLENQRVAAELGSMWAALQEERAHAERVVAARLLAVQAEAEELTHWSEHRPSEVVRLEGVGLAGEEQVRGAERPQGAPPEEPVYRSWASPFGGSESYQVPAALAHPDGPPAEAAQDAAAAAFFGADEDDGPAWARLEDPPTVHDDLLAKHPRRHSTLRDQIDPPSAMTAQDVTAPVADREFWAPEQAAAALRISQLEGTLVSLLPMLALVVVLVLILAWIG